METLMGLSIIPYLRQHFQLKSIIKARVLHSAGAGESQIDDLIGDLEELSNPTVGLAAHSGQVDIRITAKAESSDEADILIKPVEQTIRQRLGNWIYGADQETLEAIALEAMRRNGWTLAVLESGLGGDLIRSLASTPGPFLGGQMLPEIPSQESLLTATDEYRISRNADVGLGVAIHPDGAKQDVYLALITPEGRQQFMRPYGGPPEYAPRWALHHSLDVIRKL
jgi:nicotinamide-nucleotide amidase